MKRLQRIKRTRVVHLVWVPVLLMLLVSGLFVVRAHAATPLALHTRSALAATPLNATIYVTAGTLKPLFQSQLDAMVPTAFSSAIAGIVNTLPASNRTLVKQMAAALLQPSAQLTDLTPQQTGLAAGLALSLYPGDPKAINIDMLFQFGVKDSTTAQISAQPQNGSPALVNGPVATLTLPFGQLNNIAATSTCGDAALAVGLQIPVTLNTGTGTATPTGASQQLQQGRQVPMSATTSSAQNPVDAFVEIPNASLASLGSSVGTIKIDSNFSARNVRFSISGGQIVIVSDIYLGNTINIGYATSYVQPLASAGNLATKVSKTTLTLAGLFTISMDSYNQQIQQTLNSKLNGALAGKFNVTDAVIGPNSHATCVATDSLLLTGSTSLG